MILRRCESQANKRTKKTKKQQDACCSHASSLHHTCSRVCGTTACLLCTFIYSSTFSLYKYKREKGLLLILPLSPYHQSACLLLSALALMMHLLSINQSFKLSNYPPPPHPPSCAAGHRWKIYTSKVLKVLNNQFCHFLSVCFKTQ